VALISFVFHDLIVKSFELFVAANRRTLPFFDPKFDLRFGLKGQRNYYRRSERVSVRS
jgi:hypothetical protein